VWYAANLVCLARIRDRARELGYDRSRGTALASVGARKAADPYVTSVDDLNGRRPSCGENGSTVDVARPLERIEQFPIGDPRAGRMDLSALVRSDQPLAALATQDVPHDGPCAGTNQGGPHYKENFQSATSQLQHHQRKPGRGTYERRDVAGNSLQGISSRGHRRCEG